MATTRKKYRTLVELAPDPVFLVELGSGTVAEVNRAAAELLGYEVDEIEGLSIGEFHPPEAVDAYRELFERTVEAGELRTDTLADGRPLALVASDGSRVPIELHAKTVELEDRPWMLSIARDVSERRQRERELQRKHERLEAFTQIVSHDLRNPLNVATGHLELARETHESEHLDTAVEALERIERLLEQTLALARQGELVAEPEPIDIADLVDDSWSMVATGGAELVVDVTGTVRADPGRLRQVFENLFRNAVEHGGESVTVRVGRTAEGLFVADDGPGISPADRADVFDPGYSAAPGGTGFGLAIVASIVDAHGWAIAVDGSETGGARFEITGVTFVA